VCVCVCALCVCRVCACVCIPQRQVLLYLGDQTHAGIRAHVHGCQDRYDNEEPGRRAGGIHSLDHPVLWRHREKEERVREALNITHKYIGGVQ